MNHISRISEEWQAIGYWTRVDEDDETVILVGYKDKVIAAYPMWSPSGTWDTACERHMARLRAAEYQVV